jgi:hypothetical protein
MAKVFLKSYFSVVEPCFSVAYLSLPPDVVLSMMLCTHLGKSLTFSALRSEELSFY